MDFGEQYNFGQGQGDIFSGGGSFGGNTWDLGNFGNQDMFSLGGDYTGSGLNDLSLGTGFSQRFPNFNNNPYSQEEFSGDSFSSPNTFGAGGQVMQGTGSLNNLFSISPGSFAAAQMGTAPTPPTADEGWMGGVSNYLSKMFKDPRSLATLAGALFEGSQNKQQSRNTQKIVQQQQKQQELQRQQAIQRQDHQQQVVSPFDRASAANDGDSMRNAMQQKLMAAMQDPFGQPIVKAQTDALMQAQARKDAAAGRRSNMATSMPQLLASQAGIAQNYIDKLQGPAGANIQPGYPGLNNNTDVSGTLQALLQGSKANTQGYASPIFGAIGQHTQNSYLNDLLEKLRG